MRRQPSSNRDAYRRIRIGTGIGITSLLAALLTGALTHTYLIDEHLRRFEQTARNNLHVLSQSIEHAKPAGAVRSLGLTNLRATESLRNAGGPESPSLVESLTALRDGLGADITYVMDTNGTVIACSPYGVGETLTDNNYAFRPYFRRALAGEPNVYLALGITTERRGLYYAAPVLAQDPTHEILGVAVIKAPADLLERRLAGMHAVAMVIGPDGNVFAANRPDLIKHPHEQDRAENVARREGVRFARHEGPLHFESGPDGWRAVFMDPMTGWSPPLLTASAGAGAAAFTTMLLLALLRWQARWQKREARLTRARDELHHQIQESREQVRRLAAAVEQVAESILITGIDGIILYANPYLLEHTGYTREEITGAHVRIFKSGRHDDAFYNNLWETLADGRVWRGRFVNRRKGGSIFEEDAVITPIRAHADGPVTGYVAVKRDVTEREELERQVRQSQKMAAIGQLAHKVAHDFTNMLVVIMGHAEMARLVTPGDPDLRSHAEAILDAVNRITPLTSELMLFAQPADIKPREVDLGRAIESMTAMLRELAPANVTVNVTAPPGCGAVCIDTDMLEQALVHLAINAFEAMPGGGTLTVATTPVDAHDTAATIMVSDTGGGIPASDIDHVFEPFFTTKTNTRNAGLGLSTVYRIVTRHDGQVTVESEPGRGTTFTIRLPLTN